MANPMALFDDVALMFWEFEGVGDTFSKNEISSN